MTEYNLFCYSENYNDDDSFQQKRYRAFNKLVGKDRYRNLTNLVKTIIPNADKLKLSEFWKSITKDQWKQLLDIPEAKDFKKGFEFISGVKIDLDTIEIKVEGRTINISRESAIALGLIK